MKTILFLGFVTVVTFTNCSREAVALNEYHPIEYSKLSSVSTEIDQKSIQEAKKRRAAYLKNHNTH